MASNNIYDSSQSKRVQKSISRRKAYKKKIDHIQKFSIEEQAATVQGSAVMADLTMPNWTRLMDEGVFVDEDEDGEPVVGFVLARGAIKRMYDAMDENYEGYIDKDHNRSLYLGKFTKSDLRLVEIEDGRYGLDVNVKLDKTLNSVADLIREDQHRAVSVELHLDDYELISASELAEEAKWGDVDYMVPLAHEISLLGYGVVRNPRDPNAYNEQLLNSLEVKGAEMAKKNEAEVKEVEATVAESAEVEAPVETPEVEVENTSEAPAEEEAKVEAEAEAEVKPEEAEQPAEPTPEEFENAEVETKAEAEENNEVMAKVEQLAEAMDKLKASLEEKDAVIAEQKKQIAELESRLSKESVANMSVSERIGTLLAATTAVEKKQAEGGISSSTDQDEAQYASIISETLKNIN